MSQTRHCFGGFIATLFLAVAQCCYGAFPEIVNSQAPEDVPPTAQEAAARIQVPAGFDVTLFAGEPDVHQPIAMTMDDRGRLWVAECYTYGGHGFENQFRDRVVIFADDDHDGQFDRRTIFWDEGHQLSGIEYGFGGLWVLQGGLLQFLPDRDGNDVPDGEPEVLLDGFTDEAGHNVVNGLMWGPDGWLYGRHGITATSYVGKPGAAPDDRVPMNCAIWRYHPARKVFEVVTHGTTNPWGLDYDDHGEMFITNNVIGHLWHVVPGAHFERMHGEDFHPYLYELIDQCADHYHWDTGEEWTKSRDGVGTHGELGGGHSHCGGMIYLGDNWPDEYRNSIFMCNTHGRRVNRDTLHRQGAGYVGRHAPDFLLVDNRWFRGVTLLYGPDGSVYLSDWTDLGECHDHDGVHRTSGRIYRITYGKLSSTNDQRPLDVNQLSWQELVELQLHKNDWFVRHARRVLQERAVRGEDLSEAAQELSKIWYEHPDLTRRLRALWALHAIGAIDGNFLLNQLQDPEEHVRVWASLLLLEHPELPHGMVPKRALMATRDPSGLVRLYLASALQRLPLTSRWPVARGLALREEDASDPQLPLMLWYGIEPAVTTDPARALDLLSVTRVPQLRAFIARRITSELSQEQSAVSQLVELLGHPSAAHLREPILEGMTAALRGQRKAAPPSNWQPVQDALLDSNDEKVVALVRELAVVFGDGQALEELIKIAEDESADPQQRRNALSVLTEARPEGLVPTLHTLVDDRATAQLAIRALAAYDDPHTAELLVKRLDRLQDDSRQEAIATLVSRPAYARTLLQAMADGKIEPDALSAFNARQVLAFDNRELNDLLSQHWGTVRKTPGEKREQVERLRAEIEGGQLPEADKTRGQALYKRVCGNCHRLYGEGGAIGPDLTGSNRDNLDYLLENIIDPSAVVAQGFTVSTIVMNDGRVITGTILSETADTLTVQTAEQRLALDRDDVDEIHASSLSLMPDGLLEPLSAQEIADLIRYLREK